LSCHALSCIVSSRQSCSVSHFCCRHPLCPPLQPLLPAVLLYLMVNSNYCTSLWARLLTWRRSPSCTGCTARRWTGEVRPLRDRGGTTILRCGFSLFILSKHLVLGWVPLHVRANHHHSISHSIQNCMQVFMRLRAVYDAHGPGALRGQQPLRDLPQHMPRPPWAGQGRRRHVGQAAGRRAGADRGAHAAGPQPPVYG